jgi:acyl-CoA thioesterase FadM
MIKRGSGEVAASLQATYVLFDLQSRQSLALDEALRERAASRLPAAS